MSKEESKMMQGVAILLMLFLHLFNNAQRLGCCVDLLYLGDMPFVTFLSRATSPVAFFIILSGYGLYISHHNGPYNVLKKLRSLFIHYWITLIIFATLGYFIVGGEIYPGNIKSIIYNVTSWWTTWNEEIWFLFPYALVMLTSKWLVKILDKYNAWLCFGVTLFISLATGFVISRYGAQYLYNNQLRYKPIMYLSFLCPFTLGAYAAKFDLVTKAKKLVGKYQMTFWLMLLLLIAFRCCFETSAFHTLYIFAFILLFVNAPRWKCIDKFLVEMGKRSASIWFVHTYFCYYLFQDFIYSFKYPVVIYLVLLACSYVSAIVIDWINAKIQKIIVK